jgi:phage terminase large subunit-like protein
MRLRGFTLGLASFADRLGRQEIEAELLDDVPGALWTRCTIEAARPHNAPSLIRVVVTIDPAATSTADETEIIVAGRDGQGQAWCSPTRPAATNRPNGREQRLQPIACTTRPDRR